MRAILTILLAAAALTAAGCATTPTEPTDDQKALLRAVESSKLRLDALDKRLNENKLEDEGDFRVYIRDMRKSADALDTLSGTVKRLEPIDELRDEYADYVAQLGTAAGFGRAVATALENGDVKAAEKAETAYAKAALGLFTIEAAINETVEEAQ
jgi:hypothetical protein